MAKVNYNVVTHGTSGKIGDLLIFRQRNGRTIISKIAQRTKGLTPKQIAITQMFKAAVGYASIAMKDPAIKSMYDEKAQGDVTAYNLAIADYFNAPEVKEIDHSAYTGLPGSTLRILAVDDFKVTGVRVAISGNNGSLIEEGDALLDVNGAYFVYTALQNNNTLSGTSVEVVATDMAGNKTTKESLIP